MPTKLTPVDYRKLNARQKENFNFQKVSAILADYGFVTLRLTDDWQGADFIASHIDGTFVRVQLKGRLDFRRKYLGKDIWVAFHDKTHDEWYLYPHDELLESMKSAKLVVQSIAWQNGGYSFASLSPKIRQLLEPYLIGKTPFRKFNE